MIKNRNIDKRAGIEVSKLLGGGLVGAGDITYVYNDVTSEPAKWLLDHDDGGQVASTILQGYNNCVSGRNDVVFFTPESHSQAAALTWAKNMTHLIGLYPDSFMNQRSRIGHSAAVSPLITVSGYGNLMQNIYWMYGSGATTLNLLTVSGERNTFRANHFGGPTAATAADESTFRLVDVECNEVLFDSCFFGLDTIAWTDGAMVKLNGAADRSCRAIFKDCLFVMNADNAQVFFLETLAGMGAGVAFFLNCQFVNIGTALTYAINGAGLGNAKLYFDNNCSFAGCTDIVALAYEAYVLCGGINMSVNQVNTASSKLFNMLATNPDVS